MAGIAARAVEDRASAASRNRGFRPLPRDLWVDGSISLLLFGLALGYLALWPHNLGHSDESIFLHHAKRVLAGSVPHRDFFDFYTPLANYVMAAAFGLFGTQIVTAKLVMAAVHGAIVVLVYVCGRKLGVRRSLAAAAGLAHLALAQPAWPHASPHWFATALLLALLSLALWRPYTRSRLAALGALAGAITSMQQQTGAPITFAIGAYLLIDSRLARRSETPARGLSSMSKLLWFAGPAVAIPGFILLVHAILAGPSELLQQVVVHPLAGYRLYNRVSWGNAHSVLGDLGRYTFPWLLASLPLVTAPLIWLRAGLAWRESDAAAFERLGALATFSGVACVAALNRPDVAHLAFAMAVHLVVLVETVEWALGSGPARRWIPRYSIGAIALVAIAAMAGHLRGNLELARGTFAHSVQTEFGRVDFASQREVEDVERVRAALDAAPTRDLFCYPVQSSLYLTANGHNPTPHELMLPGYKTEEAYRETFAILDRRRVRYIFLAAKLMMSATDPIYAYLYKHYACAENSPRCALFRRRD